MRNLFIRLASSGLLAATLGVGFAYAGNNSIAVTGPHSNNQINNSSSNSFTETNTTTVTATNTNNQTVRGGNAVVKGNTIGGSASSGSASNWVNQSNNVNVTTPSHPVVFSGAGNSNNSIYLTGPGSNNQITNNSTNTFNESNNTSVVTTNTNTQTVSSGNAIVSGNTIGGSARSGNVWNSVNQSNVVTIGGGNAWGMGAGNGVWPQSAPQVYGNGQNNHRPNYPQYPNNNNYFNGSGYWGMSGNRYGQAYGAGPYQIWLAAYTAQMPCWQRQVNYPRPCDVISYGTIRPPCNPVPCRPVVQQPCQPCHPVVVTPPCHPQKHHCHHRVVHMPCQQHSHCQRVPVCQHQYRIC